MLASSTTRTRRAMLIIPLIFAGALANSISRQAHALSSPEANGCAPLPPSTFRVMASVQRVRASSTITTQRAQFALFPSVRYALQRLGQFAKALAAAMVPRPGVRSKEAVLIHRLRQLMTAALRLAWETDFNHVCDVFSFIHSFGHQTQDHIVFQKRFAVTHSPARFCARAHPWRSLLARLSHTISCSGDQSLVWTGLGEVQVSENGTFPPTFDFGVSFVSTVAGRYTRWGGPL